MGIYYMVVDSSRRYRIEPGRVGEGGIKDGPMVMGGVSHLFTFLHLDGEPNWRIVDDTTGGGEEYSSARESYQDVTAEAVARFNGWCDRALRPDWKLRVNEDEP